MGDDDEFDETSESGAPIYRHTPRNSEPTPPASEGDALEAIDAHVERYIGPIETVFHEIVSDLVHIDVHWVKPRPGRNRHTLITTGMSDLPMKAPFGDCYAEMLISLPPDWPISMEAFENEAHYWPVRLIKQLAHIPHEYETWLGPGHTVHPGGSETSRIADTKFTGVMVMPPVLTPDAFDHLDAGGGKTIDFLAAYPLYDEEMEYKLKVGAGELFERFEEHEITEIVDVSRANVAGG